MKDPEIRAVLRQTELQKFISDSNSRVVEELNLSPASAQIDIAVINGAFHAYEIKSASDTLNRLPNQIEWYTKIFDYITVVTEDKYENKLLNMLPDWVGVAVCDDCRLRTSRKSKRNKFQDGFYIAQLLWRDEMKSILQENNINFRSYNRNWVLSQLLSANIEIKQLSEFVRNKMKQRVNWKQGC